MDDNLLKRFFSSGRVDTYDNLSYTPNAKKTSLISLNNYEANNRYQTSHNLYTNNYNSNNYNSNNIQHFERPNTITPPEYKINYVPPNIPNQIYLPEQIKLNENNYNSFNRGPFEISKRNLPVNFLINLA
jgi:hypothetical protein